MTKPKEKDVDWDAKTKQMTAERIMDACLEAMADGDEGRLEAYLLELEDEGERAKSSTRCSRPQLKDDKFWQGKLGRSRRRRRSITAGRGGAFASPRPAPSRAPKPARVPHEPPAYLFLNLPRYFRRSTRPFRAPPRRLTSFPLDPAQMSGDVDEIEACMLDANNDTLLGVDVTTAEDGTKTFRF